MKFFGGDDGDDDSWDSGPIGIGSTWNDDEDWKRRYAEEIASGLVSGLFCRDEEVWEMVRQIKEKK